MGIVYKEPEKEALERAEKGLKDLVSEEKFSEILDKAKEYVEIFKSGGFNYPRLRAIAKAAADYVVEKLSKFPFFATAPSYTPNIYIDVVPTAMETASEEELREALRVLELAYAISDAIQYRVEVDDCGFHSYRIIDVVTYLYGAYEPDEAFISPGELKRLIWKFISKNK